MCSCGCNTCETKIRGPLLTENKVKSLLSEGLQFHIDKKIPLFETIYRIGSDEHLALIKEARKMYSRNIIDLCEEDEGLIKTNIGEFAVYEGEVVPLDLPMIEENKIQEAEYQGKDEKWIILNPYKTKKYFSGIPNSWNLFSKKPVDPNIYKSREEAEEEINKFNNIILKKQLKAIPYQGSINEAEYQGKDVKLNKPKRGGSKAYYVYVNSGKKTKDGKIKVKKVSFGSGGLRAKIKDKDARNAFAKRHNCKDKKDRTKAGYWSCNLPRYAKALGLGSNMNTYW
jgi:hypothetical protein